MMEPLSTVERIIADPADVERELASLEATYHATGVYPLPTGFLVFAAQPKEPKE